MEYEWPAGHEKGKNNLHVGSILLPITALNIGVFLLCYSWQAVSDLKVDFQPVRTSCGPPPQTMCVRCQRRALKTSCYREKASRFLLPGDAEELLWRRRRWDTTATWAPCLRRPGVAAHRASFTAGPARHGRILEVSGHRDPRSPSVERLCPKVVVEQRHHFTVNGKHRLMRCRRQTRASRIVTEGRR
jgi:hypothetical protein